MVHVKADFVEDLCAMADAELAARGISPRGRSAPFPERREGLRQLLAVEHRRIPPRPRRSFWSDILSRRPADLFLQEATRIASESEAGSDLNHYLSKGVLRAAPDAQLNDWGITHLHLGGRQSGSQFSHRINELLFVVSRTDALYFVDIGTHDSFSDHDLFETVHRNWPLLLSRSRVEGVPADDLSDAQRDALRKNGLNAVTKTCDGTTYLAPGFGQASSGINAWVVREADRLVEQARLLQEWFESQADSIATAAASRHGIVLGDPVEC